MPKRFTYLRKHSLLASTLSLVLGSSFAPAASLQKLQEKSNDPAFRDHASSHFLKTSSVLLQQLKKISAENTAMPSEDLKKIMALRNTPYYSDPDIFLYDVQRLKLETMSIGLGDPFILLLSPEINKIFKGLLFPSIEDLRRRYPSLLNNSEDFSPFLALMKEDTVKIYNKLKEMSEDLSGRLRDKITDLFNWSCLVHKDSLNCLGDIILLPPNDFMKDGDGQPDLIQQSWFFTELPIGSVTLHPDPGTTVRDGVCFKIEMFDGEYGIPFPYASCALRALPASFRSSNATLSQVVTQLYGEEIANHPVLREMMAEDLVRGIVNQVMFSIVNTADNLRCLVKQSLDQRTGAANRNNKMLQDLNNLSLRLRFAAQANIHLIKRSLKQHNQPLNDYKYLLNTQPWDEQELMVIVNKMNTLSYPAHKEYQCFAYSANEHSFSQVNPVQQTMTNLKSNEFRGMVATPNNVATEDSYFPKFSLDFGNKALDSANPQEAVRTELPMRRIVDQKQMLAAKNQLESGTKVDMTFNRVDLTPSTKGRVSSKPKSLSLPVIFMSWPDYLALRANSLVNIRLPVLGDVKPIIKDMTTRIYDKNLHLGKQAEFTIEQDKKQAELHLQQEAKAGIQTAFIQNLLPKFREEAKKANRLFIKTFYLVDEEAKNPIIFITDPANVESLPKAFSSYDDIEQPIQHKKEVLFGFYSHHRNRDGQVEEAGYIGLTHRSRAVIYRNGELKTFYPSYFYPAVKLFDLNLDPEPQPKQ